MGCINNKTVKKTNKNNTDDINSCNKSNKPNEHSYNSSSSYESLPQMTLYFTLHQKTIQRVFFDAFYEQEVCAGRIKDNNYIMQKCIKPTNY